MKKTVLGFLLVCSFGLAACTKTDETRKSAATASTSEQQKAKVTVAAEKKEKIEAAQREKIDKKIIAFADQKRKEADKALTIAEQNTTEENYSKAEKAVDAFPGANIEFINRLDALKQTLKGVNQQQASANTQSQQNNSQSSSSDMPPHWTEGEAAWEQAKKEGWTAEDWERAVYESEHEKYVLEPGDPGYVAPPDDEDGDEEPEDIYDGKSEEELDKMRQEADEWQDNFEAEQGRKATSGEIQGHWAEMNGWE